MTNKPKTPIGISDPLMTVADVARLDQTSVRTTRRAIQAGLLEVLRVGPKGHLIRITHEAYAAYRQRVRTRT